jgi:hypothetical protein
LSRRSENEVSDTGTEDQDKNEADDIINEVNIRAVHTTFIWCGHFHKKTGETRVKGICGLGDRRPQVSAPISTWKVEIAFI